MDAYAYTAHIYHALLTNSELKIVFNITQKIALPYNFHVIVTNDVKKYINEWIISMDYVLAINQKLFYH